MRSSHRQGSGRSRARRAAPACAVVGAASDKKPADQHYYDQHIQPIFTTSASATPRPATSIDRRRPASRWATWTCRSFEGVQKRRDVLRTYGGYPQPLLLLKALPEEQVLIPYQGEAAPERDPPRRRQDAIAQLGRLLRAQALAGQRRHPRRHRCRAGSPNTGQGGCSSDGPGRLRRAHRSTATAPAYQTFAGEVRPMLEHVVRVRHLPQLAAGGLLPDLRRHDRAARRQLPAGGRLRRCLRRRPGVEQSELLLRPLSPRAGGVNHTGGVFFQSREDAPGRAARLGRARCRQQPARARRAQSPGETFFEAQRDADAAPARLRARGLPQPQRLQRLPPAPGRAGLPLAAARCTATTRRRCTSSWRWTRPTCGSRALVKKNLFPPAAAASPTAAARCWRAPAPPDAPRPPCPDDRSIPATASRVLRARPSGTASSARTARAAVSPMAAGDGCRWPSCRGRPTPTPAGVRHLPRRRRPASWPTRTLGAERPVDGVGNVRSAPGALRGPGRPQRRRRARARVELRRHAGWSSRRAPARRAAWTCGCSTSAARHAAAG